MKYQIDTDKKTIQLLENTSTEKAIELLTQFPNYTLVVIKQTSLSPISPLSNPLPTPFPLIPKTPYPIYEDLNKITCSTT